MDGFEKGFEGDDGLTSRGDLDEGSVQSGGVGVVWCGGCQEGAGQ